jgi:hypothetical protein
MPQSDDDDAARRYTAGLLATATIAAGGSVDEFLLPCPSCHERQLRAESQAEWRTISSVAHGLSIPEAQIRADPRVTLDTFGRMLCEIPYVTCMACGFHVDATLDQPFMHQNRSTK